MSDERPLFHHPPWMVGIMLILGVLSLLVGLLVDSFWLVMGSPAILTLFVYIGVRITLWWRQEDLLVQRLLAEKKQSEPLRSSRDETRDSE